MATPKKPSRRKPDARETEFSRILNEHLKKIEVRKNAVTVHMFPLRDTGDGENPKDSKYFSRVSNGHITPDLRFVIEVATALKIHTGKDLTQEEVSLWLGAWLHDYLLKAADRALKRGGHTAKETRQRREAAATFINAGYSAVNRWRRSVNVRRGIDSTRPPTLADKDYILHNCAVIVGAAVRHPPSSTEQLFRENAQVSDLMYLPHLDCGPRPLFLTDNMVIALSEEERKKLLKRKHLLVIGGPIVNVATRYLNNVSVFPFCLNEYKRKFDNIFDTLKGFRSLRISQNVEMFYWMLQDPKSKSEPRPEKLIGKDLDKVRDEVKQFRKEFKLEEDVYYKDILNWVARSHHFFDPLACRVVGRSGKHPHLGVISLGKNHWADDPHFVTVAVAGFDEYGTVAALRSLLHSSFNDRPCGGILNADLPQEGSEYVKFKEAQFNWITHPYNIHDLKESLTRVQKENRSGRPPYEAFHGEETFFNQYADFIKLFKG